MIVRGTVVSGASRGAELVQIYEDRLLHILGFRPYRGTLDVKIEKALDVESYATRRLEHVLLNGRPQIYAYLIPILLKTTTGEEKCWGMRLPDTYEKDVVWLLAHENMRNKLGLNDGDDVELQFFQKAAKKKPATSFLQRL